MTGYVNLSGFDLWQVYITLGLTVAASANAVRLMFKAPRRYLGILAALATLAAFYTAAYTVLLIGPWTQAQWTHTIRGPSWIVWGFVWMYVPTKLISLALEASARNAALVPKVAEALVERVKGSISERPGSDRHHRHSGRSDSDGVGELDHDAQ